MHVSTPSNILLITAMALGCAARLFDQVVLVNGETGDTKPIQQRWGNLSPYFDQTQPSNIDDKVPDGCTVDFVNVLHRHGDRYPDDKQSGPTADVIQKIKDGHPGTFGGVYAWLNTYEYNLKEDILTDLGIQQAQESGETFQKRYADLIKAQSMETLPFVRASDMPRVVDTCLNFLIGMTSAGGNGDLYKPFQKIRETDPNNKKDKVLNTLKNELCKNLKNDKHDNKVNQYVSTYFKDITARLNKDLNLNGDTLDDNDTLFLMHFCAFRTVATVDSSNITPDISCGMFKDAEWDIYNYYWAVDYYYDSFNGNALASAAGAGWVNELLGRIQHTKIVDKTCVNHTVFNPVDRNVYMDFTHDRPLSQIFAALGLWPDVQVPVNTIATPNQLNGWSGLSTLFASRMYVERMTCGPQQYVRIIVNGGVVPLSNCGADKLGRCELKAWVKSLSNNGANWDQCFS